MCPRPRACLREDAVLAARGGVEVAAPLRADLLHAEVVRLQHRAAVLRDLEELEARVRHEAEPRSERKLATEIAGTEMTARSNEDLL